MVVREKLLMQKIKKREQVKKQLANAKKNDAPASKATSAPAAKGKRM